MDIICSDIVNETFVNVDYEGISDIQGIEYFDNLALFFAYGNLISTLPPLNQTSLVNIQLGSNQLTSISNFPPNLLILNISDNPNLLSIPALPNSLYSYDATSNPNLPFPTWPSGLLDLKLGNCGLTSVPPVPAGLETFFLENNPLIGTILPGQIPNTVTTLTIGNCGLTQIPVLPPNLESMSISQNSISIIENLPASLTFLQAMNNPNITQLNGLPDSMDYFNFNNCNISIVDSLPMYCAQIDLDDNQITSIPRNDAVFEHDQQRHVLLVNLLSSNDEHRCYGKSFYVFTEQNY